jgi:hypothetical protein
MSQQTPSHRAEHSRLSLLGDGSVPGEIVGAAAFQSQVEEGDYYRRNCNVDDQRVLAGADDQVRLPGLGWRSTCFYLLPTGR